MSHQTLPCPERKYPLLLAERPYFGRTQILDIFQALATAESAVLLDSSADESGRFDMASAWPVATMTTQGARTDIEEGQTSQQLHGDPFSLMRQLWTKYQPAHKCPHQLPFVGGLVFFASYDLGRRLENLPDKALHDILLPDLHAGIYTWAVLVDHERQHCGLWQFAETPAASLTRALDAFHGHDMSNAGSRFHLNGTWQSNFSRAQYGSAFQRVQDYIHAGDCYQINLAQRFSAGFSGSPYEAYRRLSPLNRAPFAAYGNLPNGQILSLSPERFIRADKAYASTEPIKGTRPRGTDQTSDDALKQELAHSEKDQAENVMIVDLLRNDFGRSCAIGSVRVPELFTIKSFPAVHHMISKITGEIAVGKDALDLLRGAFPGGSITGAPKIRAMQIIEELEPHRRSYYCGSVGYYDFDARMDSNIAIRTLVCHDQKIHCWAGGGLVADSMEQAEFDETLHKVSKLLPALEQS